jgi:hypothetical protein
MELIEIYVHLPDQETPQSITIERDAQIITILERVSPNQHGELEIFIEGSETPLPREQRLHEHGIKDQHRLRCHPKLIHYTVDDEPQESTHHKLTPVAIMSKAGLDPKGFYLVRLFGKHEEESYKEKPEEPIHLHNGMRFIAVLIGPTPVS